MNDGRVWNRVYCYEFNNGMHIGYSEKYSRVFKSLYEDICIVDNFVYGTFEKKIDNA